MLAAFFHDHTAESQSACADTATWAGTNLTEPSQNFICWPKGKQAGQTAGRSSAHHRHTVSPWIPAGRAAAFPLTLAGHGPAEHTMLGVIQALSALATQAGRKRVSIPAEPCFRQEPFPLSWGRAGPCRAFDMGTSEAGLWGEQDHRALMLYPKSIARLSPLCWESCLSPSNAAVPVPALHSRAGDSQERGCH